MIRPIAPRPRNPSRLSVFLVTGAAMALLSLAACSRGKDDGDDASTKPAPPAQTTTSAPEPSPGGTPTTRGKSENGAATVNTQETRH